LDCPFNCDRSASGKKWRDSASDSSPHFDDLVLFASVTSVVAVSGYGLFLLILSYPTMPWYYFSLIALLAGMMDAGMHAFAQTKRLNRLLRLAIISCAAIALAPSVLWVSQAKLTNFDRIAAALTKTADSQDLVVISPWWPSIAFKRYYQGVAPWISIPPIDEYHLIRSDFIKQVMAQKEPLQGALSRIESTLRSGHNVWLVTAPEYRATGEMPIIPAPAPQLKTGWFELPYHIAWSQHVDYFIHSHSAGCIIIPMKEDDKIISFEKYELLQAKGWR
jgi:hypothetical protein